MNNQDYNDQKSQDDYSGINPDQSNASSPWGDAPQSNPLPADSGKGLSIAGFVLGIVSLVFSCLGAIALAGLIPSIVGIVLSSIGRKKAKLAGAPTGLGTAGFVMSIISCAICGIVFVIYCIVIAIGFAV